jgi:hypothetical protein
MRDSTVTISRTKLLRSPVVLPVCSVVVATITGILGESWTYSPIHHWTTTFSVPIAAVVTITAILIAVRSRYPFRSLLACLCILGAMCVDLVPFVGYQTGLLSGVLLAQIGLFAVVSLPAFVRLEKAILWTVATFVQSVWIYDVLATGKHISFFGPTMTQ